MGWAEKTTSVADTVVRNGILNVVNGLNSKKQALMVKGASF